MLNIATMGTSKITHAFIEATEALDEAKVVAVFSRKENTARSLANKYGIKTIYTDLTVLLADPNIHCVYIATPNVLHFEHVMACLREGKHVICEKPIFLTSQEWDLAYAEADRRGLYLFEAMRHLHTPNFTRLKESLKEVGDVSSVYLHRIRYSSKYDAFLQGQISNVFSKEAGGGALRDLGVYPLSLSLAIFGVPRSTSYHAVLLDNQVDGSGVIVLNYNGFNCVIMVSKIATSYNNGEIHGQKGTITVDNPAPIKKIKLHSGGKMKDVGIEESLPNMSYQIKNFIHIMNERDHELYHYYREISKQVTRIIEQY